MIQAPPPVLQLFESVVLPVVPVGEQSLLRAAFDLATHGHHGQTRDEGTPYIEHPVRVAALLAETGHSDAEVLAAALLHDTLEDCEITEAELLDRFGPRVARLVKAVTKQIIHPDHPPGVSFKRMPADAKPIKLADRLDNLRSLHRSPVRRKRTAMLEETKWRYLPVAREVGGRLGELFLEWWDRWGEAAMYGREELAG